MHVRSYLLQGRSEVRWVVQGIDRAAAASADKGCQNVCCCLICVWTYKFPLNWTVALCRISARNELWVLLGICRESLLVPQLSCGEGTHGCADDAMVCVLDHPGSCVCCAPKARRVAGAGEGAWTARLRAAGALRIFGKPIIFSAGA